MGGIRSDMLDEKDLPGPCSVRQHMYMFPEEYSGVPIDVTLYGGELCASI